MNRELIRQHLELAERHVAEGEDNLERQRQILCALRNEGYATEKAEKLLFVFEQSQRLHASAVAWIRDEFEYAD
jgi:hypothetical protein